MSPPLRSDCAILYNDRSVLENHHISAVFRMMQDDEMNIFVNLTKDEFAELRALVIEMVLATDMSCHFQQVKSMKTALQQLERSQWRQTSLDEHLELGDINADLAGFRSTWTRYIQENKQKWKERAASGITNQASIEELSPYEEDPPAPPTQHKHNGEVE
ncbi:UNVERIFIED_CONTAM: hypothetical protein H355_016630 [Colinus virginianus]|nr:hypothetical protein H355_016630 [Colinus virginianus]